MTPPRRQTPIWMSDGAPTKADIHMGVCFCVGAIAPTKADSDIHMGVCLCGGRHLTSIWVSAFVWAPSPPQKHTLTSIWVSTFQDAPRMPLRQPYGCLNGTPGPQGCQVTPFSKRVPLRQPYGCLPSWVRHLTSIWASAFVWGSYDLHKSRATIGSSLELHSQSKARRNAHCELKPQNSNCTNDTIHIIAFEAENAENMSHEKTLQFQQ